MFDVFMSYSSLDEATAVELCHLLEQQGLVCFRDHGVNGIGPGEIFINKLQDALRESRSLVFLLSNNSVTDGCWAANEVIMAKELSIPIFPVQISDLPSKYGLQLALNAIQCVNATHSSMEMVAKVLLFSLKRLAEKEKPIQPISSTVQDISSIAKQHSLIGIKLFDNEEYEDAIPELRLAAKLGDADAQYVYGLCYLHGLGSLKKDVMQADSWFKKSAEHNNANAKNILAVHLYVGEGIADGNPDKTQAEQLFLQAAADGNGDAMLNLGLIARERKDTHQSIEWFQKAEQTGNIEAAFQLGQYYNEIDNDEQAFQYYRKAADRNHGEAQNMIGRWYSEHGNKQEAIKWFERASKNNSALGLLNLGLCIFEGVGTRKNVEKGIAIIYRASQCNLPEAQNILKKCIRSLPLWERIKYDRYLH